VSEDGPAELCAVCGCFMSSRGSHLESLVDFFGVPYQGKGSRGDFVRSSSYERPTIGGGGGRLDPDGDGALECYLGRLRTRVGAAERCCGL